jgi:hypothetical protein
MHESFPEEVAAGSFVFATAHSTPHYDATANFPASAFDSVSSDKRHCTSTTTSSSPSSPSTAMPRHHLVETRPAQPPIQCPVAKYCAHCADQVLGATSDDNFIVKHVAHVACQKSVGGNYHQWPARVTVACIRLGPFTKMANLAILGIWPHHHELPFHGPAAACHKPEAHRVLS